MDLITFPFTHPWFSASDNQWPLRPMICVITTDTQIIRFITTHDFTYGMSCHTWYALIAHFAPPYVLSPCRISTCDPSHSHMSIIQLWWPIASLSSYDCRHPHASYPHALTLGLGRNAIKSPSDDLLHSIHTPCHPWIWNTVKSSSVIKIWYMRLDSMQDPYHHDLPYMVMSMTHDSLWLPCDLYQITMTLQPRCNPWTILDHLRLQRTTWPSWLIDRNMQSIPFPDPHSILHYSIMTQSPSWWSSITSFSILPFQWSLPSPHDSYYPLGIHEWSTRGQCYRSPLLFNPSLQLHHSGIDKISLILSHWWSHVVIFQDLQMMQPRHIMTLMNPRYIMVFSWPCHDLPWLPHDYHDSPWPIMIYHDHLMTATPPMHSLLFHRHMFNTCTVMHSFRMFPLFSLFLLFILHHSTILPLPHLPSLIFHLTSYIASLVHALVAYLYLLIVDAE